MTRFSQLRTLDYKSRDFDCSQTLGRLEGECFSSSLMAAKKKKTLAHEAARIERFFSSPEGEGF